MARLFTLTDDIRTIATQAVDDLIDQLGKDCELYYPPRMTTCVNCVYDSIGQKSSNRWVDGGPMFFPDGSICPVCSGEGMRAEQETKIIRMLLAWQPKDFFRKAPAGVQVPAGVIQAKGYLSDLPKIMRAREMVVQPKHSGIITWRFVLDGEPADTGNIIQGRYIVSQWKRAG